MKKLLYTLGALVVAGAAQGSTITPQQALERLAESTASAPRKVAGIASRPTLAHTSFTVSGEPAVYIFNAAESEGGYMILAADDAAYPLLGYSDSGSFAADEMAPAMEWWLSEYGRQIEYASRSHIKLAGMPSRASEQQREAIAPLLTTKWDQIEPFNNRCPLYGTTRTYTGCVATSMAQVMNYWKYPERGQGTISYTSEEIEKNLTLDFSKTAFKWDDMLDSYTGDYTDAQADAVAYLMRACGYSVKMDFSISASSALSLQISNALIKYFKYDGDTEYRVRAFYSTSEWEQMIYDNLKNVGPLPYGGSSMMGGGHSFVCDGYDGNGFFHFNWGWSGMSDGYYRLDALTPSILGAGGGSGGGYSFSQDAVFGIQPPTGNDVPAKPLLVAQGGSLAGSVEGSLLTFSLEVESGACWLNYNARTMNITFGATFEPVGQNSGETVTAPITREEPVTLKPGYGTSEVFVPQIDLAALSLPDGSYKVTFVADVAEDADFGWMPTAPYHGYYNYITLTKNGADYTIEKNSVDRLRVVDGGFNGNLYFGCVADTYVTIANDTDSELTQGFAPALFVQDGSDVLLYFLGGSELVTVAPHSQVEHRWLTDFTLMQNISGMNSDAEMLLTFFDETTYNFYHKDFLNPVTMKINPGQPQIRMTNFIVEDAPSTIGMTNNGFGTIYTISDPSEIKVKFTATLATDVPFAYQMLICMLGDGSNDEGGQEIVSFAGTPVILNAKDDSYDFAATLSLPTMEPDKIYTLMGAYVWGSYYLPLASQMRYVRYVESAGIEDVTADPVQTGIADVYYNLQGVAMGTDRDALPAGIYIRNGKKELKF